jgi:hypothetical protein
MRRRYFAITYNLKMQTKILKIMHKWHCYCLWTRLPWHHKVQLSNFRLKTIDTKQQMNYKLKRIAFLHPYQNQLFLQVIQMPILKILRFVTLDSKKIISKLTIIEEIKVAKIMKNVKLTKPYTLPKTRD